MMEFFDTHQICQVGYEVFDLLVQNSKLNVSFMLIMCNPFCSGFNKLAGNACIQHIYVYMLTICNKEAVFVARTQTIYTFLCKKKVAHILELCKAYTNSMSWSL